MNDHHLHHSVGDNPSYNEFRGGMQQHQPIISRHALSSCPTSIATYAALHLDSIGKILNHVLFLTVAVDVFLFLSSFAVSYLPNHLGFNTVLCSFLLAAVSVTVLLIVNNSRISALSVLAPTEFMVGVACGCTLGAAVLAALLSTSYKNVTHCSDLSASMQHDAKNSTAAALPYDPDFATACTNSSSMTGIWFWAGLSAWLNAIATMLLATGRYQLSEHYQQYETIGGVSDDHHHPSSSGHQPQHHDFEETYRRQQQEILGASQAAAVQSRAASMFVGDYSTIPEVRESTSMSTVTLNDGTSSASNPKRGKGGEAAQILSV